VPKGSHQSCLHNIYKSITENCDGMQDFRVQIWNWHIGTNLSSFLRYHNLVKQRKFISR